MQVGKGGPREGGWSDPPLVRLGRDLVVPTRAGVVRSGAASAAASADGLVPARAGVVRHPPPAPDRPDRSPRKGGGVPVRGLACDQYVSWLPRARRWPPPDRTADPPPSSPAEPTETHPAEAQAPLRPQKPHTPPHPRPARASAPPSPPPHRPPNHPRQNTPETEQNAPANRSHANHPQHHEHTMVTKSPQAEHPALPSYLAAPH